jgi:hypothetical protein
VRFFRTTQRTEFNLVLHVVFPVISSIALLWVAWKSLDPLPAAPVSYAPVIAGLWLVFGGLTLWGLRRSGRQEWRALSQQIFNDREQSGSPQEPGRVAIGAGLAPAGTAEAK